MKKRPLIWFLIFPLVFSVSGCVNIIDLNTAFQRLDRAWQLDYQKTEDEDRWRVVESDPATTYRAVRQTFLELGLPILKESISGQTLIAQNEAPLPLTLDEWKQVVNEENPRFREIMPWYMVLRDTPNTYIVTIKARIRSFEDRSFVVIDYTIDAPELRRMGVIPPTYGPPSAVKMATTKIWRTLKDKLGTLQVKEPRRRRTDEFEL